MLNKIFSSAVVIFFGFTRLFAQTEISAGINAGGGFISANSPDEGAFTTAVFIDGYLNPGDYISARIGFIYAADFNSIVPDSRKQYYPSIKGFYLKGIYSYYLTENFYMEQGLGLLTLNDRVYSDRNNWDYGIVISLLAGIDFRENLRSGFKLGIGLEYGITLVNYTIQYYSTYFQLQYIF